ncbi:cysteine synthase, putative [Aduncisulcus paluster]|nr:cysteine synthase, putative [Aduncisulcus paluster]
MDEIPSQDFKDDSESSETDQKDGSLLSYDLLKRLQHSAKHARQRGIVLPTLEQQQNPSLIPDEIRSSLKSINPEALDPLNLFRINWYNDGKGGFSDIPAHIVLPPSLTGLKCKVAVMLGAFFPTGAHKVGATYSVLSDKLVTGAFDPSKHTAVFPSTGNYARGGAFNSSLLGCKSVSILPKRMSRERFEDLAKLGSSIIKTPGIESSIKEVFDTADRLVREDPENVVVLNQFTALENSMWHYNCTGPALESVFEAVRGERDELSGVFMCAGSAGTLGGGTYLVDKYPGVKCGVGEAIQCPTMMSNGFGEHRIEGIGDKHVPWIFKARTPSLIAGIDDNHVMRVFRLFNEPAGRAYLRKTCPDIDEAFIESLSLLGISSVANILGALSMSRYYEYGPGDVVVTVATDTSRLYHSRLETLRMTQRTTEHIATADKADDELYSEIHASYDAKLLRGEAPLVVKELLFSDKKRIHNQKYTGWVEPGKKTISELKQQWSDKSYWQKSYAKFDVLNERIQMFNRLIFEDACKEGDIDMVQRSASVCGILNPECLLHSHSEGLSSEEEE